MDKDSSFVRFTPPSMGSARPYKSVSRVGAESPDAPNPAKDLEAALVQVLRARRRMSGLADALRLRRIEERYDRIG
jgi:hypothetical protein